MGPHLFDPNLLYQYWPKYSPTAVTYTTDLHIRIVMSQKKKKSFKQFDKMPVSVLFKMTNIRASKHHTSYFWLVSCVVVGRLGLVIGPLSIMGIYKFTRIYKEEYPAIGPRQVLR